MAKMNNRLLLIFLKILIMVVLSNGEQCPIGFDIIFINKSHALCIQIKNYETFFDKYIRCSGNLQPIDFFKNENITKYIDNKTRVSKELGYFWIDYVRAYEGGPFINWLIGSKFMGSPLSTDVKWNNTNNTIGMCAVYDSYTKAINVVNCEERYKRLCIIETYEGASPMSWDCPISYLPFSAPIPSCIYVPLGNVTNRKAPLRATWVQSTEICRKYEGHLIHRGYVYANHPEFHQFVQDHELPLGIHRQSEDVFMWTDYSMEEDKLVSLSEMKFVSSDDNLETKIYASLLDSKWILREPNYIYNYAMCEYFVKLPSIQFFLSMRNTSLILHPPGLRSNPEVQCFTDSETYYPRNVSVLWQYNNTYNVTFRDDGYYWCLVTNMNEYSLNTSEKVLFLKDSNFMYDNLYSALISTKNQTPIIDDRIYPIREVLNRYFFNSTSNEISSLKIKRMYSDGHILLHVKFKENTLNESKLFHMQHTSISLNSIDIKYMRNVLYCNAQHISPEDIRKFSFGSVLPNDNCSNYICAGDFNIGAYWILETLDGCIIETTEYPTTTEYITTTETDPTTMQPNEQVTELANNLQTLVSGTVNSTQLTAVTNQINNILDLGQDVEIPKSVLQDLDTIINKVELKENETRLKIIEPNIAIAVAERGGPTPVVGVQVTKVIDGFNSDSLQILTQDEMDSTVGKLNTSEVIVNIPPNIGDSTSRLSFVIFKNDNAFNQNTTNDPKRVNSRVLSISLGNITIFEDGEYVDIYLKPYDNNINSSESKMCAHWNFSAGVNGDWSTEGCKLIPRQKATDLDKCRCNHLTHFAEIIILSNEDIGDINTFALTVISYVGCILSLLGLFVIGLTGVMFRSWRSDFNNKIWLHLSASTAILMVSFLLIALVDFTTYTGICIFAGVALHYSVLSSFCWMLISAVLSYKRLVTVFSKNTSHRLLKASLFGWLTPVCPIVLLFIIDSDNYVQHFNMGKISKSFCYPSQMGFWLTLFLPVALIVIVNAILFFVIIYSVFMSRKIQRHGDSKQLFRSLTVSFLLFFLFGLTWGFALLSEHIVMTYLFCITATLQGLVLFIFFIVGNKKTRDLWGMRLHLKEKGKAPVTSTMSRSTSKVKTGSSKSISLHNVSYKSTKPRSMSGNVESSDSRFS